MMRIIGSDHGSIRVGSVQDGSMSLEARPRDACFDYCVQPYLSTTGMDC